MIIMGAGRGPASSVPTRTRVSTRSERVRSIGPLAASVIALIACLWFLSWARALLIPLSFAMFLTLCLRPPVNWLARLHIPCSIGAALVLMAVCASIAVPLSRTRVEIVSVLDQMPAAARHLRHEINAALNNPGSMAHRLRMLFDLPQSVGPRATTVPAAVAPEDFSTQASLEEGTRQLFVLTSEFGGILFLVYLMLASSGRLQRRMEQFESIPQAWGEHARAIFIQIERSLRRYLGVLILTNAMLGLAVWGTFELLGVHYAAAWGIAAGVLHFVPYVGPVLIAGGSGIFSSVQFDSLARGLVIAGTTLGLSSLIGVVLQTWLLGRSARMNMVALFVTLLFWGWIWGLPGLVLATPIMMAFKAVCSQLPSLAWIDALLDGQERAAAASGRESSVLRPIQ
jgi:predicted PurR-regulated permease PerM